MTTIWRKTLHWVSGRLPCRFYAPTGEPTLFERYFLFRVFGVTAYLHHYLRSDPDRGHHDHPWEWAWALPLAGGYTESRIGFFGGELWEGCRRRRPLWPYRLTGEIMHRVVIRNYRTSWSLFVHGPHTKTWGFYGWSNTDSGRRFTYTPASGRADTQDDHGWWKRAPAGRMLQRARP